MYVVLNFSSKELQTAYIESKGLVIILLVVTKLKINAHKYPLDINFSCECNVDFNPVSLPRSLEVLQLVAKG